MTDSGEATKGQNNVGPIFRSGELADAAIQALEIDNPEKEFEIDDEVAYVRVATESECIIQRETMEEILGREFDMQELEIVLASFAGQIEADQDHMRFYYERRT